MSGLKIYDGLEQGSDEWLAARCGLLTASQIGKLITPTGKLADNDTSRGLALTIAAERITGWTEHVYPNFDMMRGTDEEPIARGVYEEHFAPVTEVGFMTREIGGVTIGFSPDGLVAEDGLIEIKSRKVRAQLQTVLANAVPAENMAQIQCGLLVSGRQWCDYVSFSASLPLFVFRVMPDLEMFELLANASVKFEADVADIITRYTTATKGMPATERRIEVEDLIF
jgi:hypothetical protein